MANAASISSSASQPRVPLQWEVRFWRDDAGYIGPDEGGQAYYVHDSGWWKRGQPDELSAGGRYVYLACCLASRIAESIDDATTTFSTYICRVPECKGSPFQKYANCQVVFCDQQPFYTFKQPKTTKK